MTDIETIYNEYFVRLCEISYYIVKDSFEAQDIVSSRFESLLSKPHILSETKEKVYNYLVTSIKNRSYTYLASNKRHSVILKEGPNSPSQDLQYASEIYDPKLLNALKKLPHKSIKILRNIYLEGKSYNEIAAESKISHATINNLRDQGIVILSKIFKGRGQVNGIKNISINL